MVLEKSNVMFYNALLCIKTCLMDVALVRGWNGVYDVYYQINDVFPKTDNDVKYYVCGDKELEWYIKWDEYGCRLCDGRVGDDCMYLRVRCKRSDGFCLYDVYATLPDGLYDLNLQNLEK